MDPKKIKTTIVISSESLWALRRKGADQRINSDSAAVEAAIECWASEPPGDSIPGTHPNDRWHNMLADILASGDREAISAVRQNLLVFHRIKMDKAPIPQKKRA